MATISRTKYNLTTSSTGGGGRYDVSNLTYPPDLFGGVETYSNCWVMININVQDRASKGSVETVELSADERDRRIPYGGENIGAGGAVGAGAIAGGIALGSKLIDHLKNPVEFAANGKKAALEALTKTAGAAGAAALPFLLVGAMGKRKALRIKSAIQLPMPNQLTTNYSTSWDMENTWLMDMMSRLPGVTVDALANIGKPGAMTQLADPAANFVLNAAQFANAGTISAATGLAANPKKELVFNSVDFRTFNMSYRFYPKSREESVILQNVIKELKYHMHPSYLSESKFTFVYPSEFDITFYAKDGKENLYVNKIATCVLKNMVVNSTADGLWAAHEEGAPNGIDIQLQFQELALMTKDTIDKGF